MKSVTARIGGIALSLLVALPALAGVIPVRGTSRNGEDSIAPFWNLMGPTSLLTLTKGTEKVMVKYQVVCPTQDVSSVVDSTNTQNAGTCAGGSYLYIFQLRSTATNVTVLLSGLMGFTPDANDPNYGVMLCDPTNDLQMCTTATQDQLPAITFSTSGATNGTASFFIPSFPNFPAGKNHQGQGLTIFVLTTLGQPRPVTIPRIALK
jgi:hypothetical protein